MKLRIFDPLLAFFQLRIFSALCEFINLDQIHLILIMDFQCIDSHSIKVGKEQQHMAGKNLCCSNRNLLFLQCLCLSLGSLFLHIYKHFIIVGFFITFHIRFLCKSRYQHIYCALCIFHLRQQSVFSFTHDMLLSAVSHGRFCDPPVFSREPLSCCFTVCT